MALILFLAPCAWCRLENKFAMLSHFRKFIGREDGAVTVDWVVITAALVGLAAAVVLVLQPSLMTSSGALNSYLEGVGIETSFAEPK